MPKPKRRPFKPPVRLLCALGTLAHNRAFTPREMAEYAGSTLATKITPTIKWLKRHKLVTGAGGRGTLYPTRKGWGMIEKACGR